MDVQAAYERLADMDLGDLSPQQRRMVAIGELRADVNNGGFDQYFLNSAGDLVLDALEAAASVGAEELASLIRRAVDILDVKDPTDRDTRQNRLMTLDEEEFESLVRRTTSSRKRLISTRSCCGSSARAYAKSKIARQSPRDSSERSGPSGGGMTLVDRFSAVCDERSRRDP